MGAKTQEKMSKIKKNDLHHLIELLPRGEHYTAYRFLHFLIEQNDPLARALTSAPMEEELLTPEEEIELHESRKELENGDIVSLDELENQLFGTQS